MKGKAYSQEQVMRIVHKAEPRLHAAERCGTDDRAEQSFFQKAANNGKVASEGERVEQLERENAELRKIVTNQALDIRLLREMNSEKQ